jgi:CheY-like chemotaxis protein
MLTLATITGGNLTEGLHLDDTKVMCGRVVEFLTEVEQHPDLIFLYLSLPEIAGAVLLAKLRADSSLKSFFDVDNILAHFRRHATL